ncbi:trypsin-like peptidase domain-containing protein [Breoghania sp. L-A4]|uniref:S1C family serine protease n=1 Tax=Breoghania sp. L-A4 TaxID=2304600 RepID=UPI0013C2C835|nr:trypsin-like peptidase domain-containing protein [Breoghania sp. L-A4]
MPTDNPSRLRGAGKRVWTIAAALTLCLCAPAGAFDQSMVSAVAKARQSVVSVLPDWPQDAGRVEEPEGSGVVVGDGRTVLTANHVIGSARTLRIRLENGDVMPAELAFRDVETDVAILTIASPLPPILLARDGDPEPAEPVCAIGNAFGLGLSVSCGVVSAIHRAGAGFNPIEDFVQTDASVNPGASGGALVDAQGHLVGLLSAIFTKGTDADIGVNFAVSAPLLAALLRQYDEHDAIAHLRLGVVLQSEPQPGTSGPAGLRVLRVEAGSRAERAGLAVGDLVTAVGPVRVAAIEGLRGLLARSDGQGALSLVRDGETVRVPLGGLLGPPR